MKKIRDVYGIYVEVDEETKRFVQESAVILGMSIKKLVLKSLNEYIKRENPKYLTKEIAQNIIEKGLDNTNEY
jgi:hypothetical protein